MQILFRTSTVQCLSRFLLSNKFLFLLINRMQYMENPDTEKMASRVISILEKVTKPALINVKIAWPSTWRVLKESIIGTAYLEEPFMAFVFAENISNDGLIKINATELASKQPVSFETKIELLRFVTEEEELYKMAARQFIIDYPMEKSEEVEMATKYGILTDKMSFILLDKSTSPMMGELQTVTVPGAIPVVNPYQVQAPAIGFKTATKCVGGKAARKALPLKCVRGSALMMGGVKKPHRFRPGTVALREIRQYQQSTDLLIPRKEFKSFLDEIVKQVLSNKRQKKEDKKEVVKIELEDQWKPKKPKRGKAGLKVKRKVKQDRKKRSENIAKLETPQRDKLDEFNQLINLQNTNGSWPMNPYILSFTKRKTLKDLSKTIPSTLHKIPELYEAWATILVIWRLLEKYKHRKGSCAMLLKKAKQWLEKRGISADLYREDAIIEFID
eukprot:TRINITY_DN2141_c0_g1_i3.p2 TRINITY_DN2141_c0_g1~~TRINITY_DN2141_c0_g1_i3.p2  ORF type:complete len:445 (-),score=35.61 TRINITY_DN2141_c0_g1_i3:65-1399(-)